MPRDLPAAFRCLLATLLLISTSVAMIATVSKYRSLDRRDVVAIREAVRP